MFKRKDAAKLFKRFMEIMRNPKAIDALRQLKQLEQDGKKYGF